MVAAIIEDLFFLGKVQAVAKQLGIELRNLRAADAGIESRSDSTPTLILLDLNLRSQDPLKLLETVRKSATANVKVVAFGSHVEVDMLQAARAAGADEVLARSEFSRRLPEILGEVSGIG